MIVTAVGPRGEKAGGGEKGKQLNSRLREKEPEGEERDQTARRPEVREREVIMLKSGSCG